MQSQAEQSLMHSADHMKKNHVFCKELDLIFLAQLFQVAVRRIASIVVTLADDCPSGTT
jgi:hypothetical protein